MNASRRTLLWLRAEQVELARAAAAAAELEIAVAGSPVRGQSGEVAAALGAAAHDDLRGAVAAGGVDLVLILAPGEFGSAEDAAALLGATTRGAKVASMEPLPARAIDLAGDAWRWRSAGVPSAVPALLPRMRTGRAWREAWEEGESAGPARSANVVMLCGTAEGSLGARLADAMDLLLSVFGEPETIDAAYAGGHTASGLHALPGETLRGLSGDLTANLRFGGGRAVSVLASDRAGRWERAAMVMCESAWLRCDDEAFRWTAIVDGEAAPEPRRQRKRGPAALLAEAITALLAAPSPALPEEPGVASVLAACQAALLSARTGQPESPATIRRMLGVE